MGIPVELPTIKSTVIDPPEDSAIYEEIQDNVESYPIPSGPPPPPPRVEEINSNQSHVSPPPLPSRQVPQLPPRQQNPRVADRGGAPPPVPARAGVPPPIPARVNTAASSTRKNTH